MIKALTDLMASLPEILALIKLIQAEIKEQQTDARVKDELAKIAKAFQQKDARALDDIFNRR